MQSDKKRRIAISLIVISTLTFGLVFSPHQKIAKTQVCIENHCIDIAIADTPKKQEQGLMYIKHMSENSGMLFVFEKEDIYTFWMKNTLIPLDILRINNNKEIVDIQEATPCISKKCETYTPQNKATYVLEINKGLCKKRGINTGQKISISY